MEIKPFSWAFFKMLWFSGDENIPGNSDTTVKLNMAFQTISAGRTHRFGFE